MRWPWTREVTTFEVYRRPIQESRWERVSPSDTRYPFDASSRETAVQVAERIAKDDVLFESKVDQVHSVGKERTVTTVFPAPK